MFVPAVRGGSRWSRRQIIGLRCGFLPGNFIRRLLLAPAVLTVAIFFVLTCAMAVFRESSGAFSVG